MVRIADNRRSVYCNTEGKVVRGGPVWAETQTLLERAWLGLNGEVKDSGILRCVCGEVCVRWE